MPGQDEDAVVIRRVWEPELGGDLEDQLRSLLQRCFPGYPPRAYFKLPPHFRYVVTVDGVVIAQMGVELRLVRVGGEVARTFGIVDLCVDESERSHGLASRLLRELTKIANGSGIDFVLLFADDDRLYVQKGWVHVANRCSWVKIDEPPHVGSGHHGVTRGFDDGEGNGNSLMGHRRCRPTWTRVLAF